MSSLEKDTLCGFDSDRVYELDRLQAEQDRSRLHAVISGHLSKVGIEHESLRSNHILGGLLLIPKFIHMEIHNHSVQLWQIIPTFQPPYPHLSILPSDPQLLDKIVQWLNEKNAQVRLLIQKIDESIQSSWSSADT